MRRVVCLNVWKKMNGFGKVYMYIQNVCVCVSKHLSLSQPLCSVEAIVR